MGCNVGCLNGKLSKVFNGKAYLTNGERVVNDYKLLYLIVDFLPLKNLVRSSRANK